MNMVLQILIAITFASVRSCMMVNYRTVNNCVGKFSDKAFTCGVKYLELPYSGYKIDNTTMECHGLPRNWTSDVQVSEDNMYVTKTSVRDVYSLPFNLRNGAPRYKLQIPRLLFADTIVQFVIQRPSDYSKFTIVFEHFEAGLSLVSFRMRVYTSSVQFVHAINGSRAIEPKEDVNMYIYSLDTPTTIEFIIRHSIIEVYVDGSHFYDWKHRHPPSEFEQLRILPHTGSDRLYIHSVSVVFPDL